MKYTHMTDASSDAGIITKVADQPPSINNRCGKDEVKMKANMFKNDLFILSHQGVQVWGKRSRSSSVHIWTGLQLLQIAS